MDTVKQLNANEFIVKIQELEKENARQRKILNVHGISYAVDELNIITKESLQAVSHTVPKLSLQEKVALFRSVFQGRDDVFAKRWYSSATNKSGYQPVCEREWNREFCDKRKYKCVDCPNRQFATELRHGSVEGDASHDGSLSVLVQSALFEVEQHLEFFNFHELTFLVCKNNQSVSILCYRKLCRTVQ